MFFFMKTDILRLKNLPDSGTTVWFCCFIEGKNLDVPYVPDVPGFWVSGTSTLFSFI